MMHGVLALLLVHVLAWLGDAHGSQIIHGKKVPNVMMPYMVSLQGNKGHTCGGFLIDQEFVITAAHCNGLSHVVLGAHNLRKVDNRTRREIAMRCPHPSYTEAASGHDIMLLKLSQKASLDQNVNLIQLPDNTKLKDNQKCRVAGWGATKTRGKSVDTLQMVDVSIINRGVCDQNWKSKDNVKLPGSIICAGGYNTKAGFCNGDSGGPLVCGAKAVGVVSFNNRNNCKYPNLPNVYTDISQHVSWIKKILKKKQCVK